jgi:tetratricopeptide (TPR) repeat protein
VRVLLWIGLLAPALCAIPAYAESLRERALRLAREGRCEAALADLASARAEAPRDAEVAGLEGLCELRLRRYGDAVESLEAAVAAAPDRADLELALAMARFHADDVAGAAQALAAAKALESDAEYQLYAGMVRLAQGDAAGAAAALERARSLDAARVEPVASYYLGLALAARQEREQAGAALRRVTDAWAGTDWSTEAARALARLEQGEGRMLWGAVGAGVAYDDNVALRGRDAPLPRDISGEDDVLGVWTANAGAELWKWGGGTLGAMASYRGTTHVELSDFDAHFPSATLWLDQALGASLNGRLRYDFGYAWEGGHPFVSTNGLLGSLERGWGRFGRTEVFAQGYFDDYYFSSDDVVDGPAAGPGSPCADPTAPCGPAGLDEHHARERDGTGVSVGIAHTLPLSLEALWLRGASLSGGYRYTVFDSDGREYSYDAHELHLGFAATLPAALVLDVVAAYTLRPYRHPSTFPDPNDVVDGVEYPLSHAKRDEATTRFELGLSRSFGDHTSVSVTYRYLDNHSNVDVFDFDQNVVGVSITLGWSREL